MTNTYAINTTRGKEFEVEADLREMGVNPWVPRQLAIKHVKERKDPIWYDRPYVGKLMFCVFPAVLYRDVCEHKHVIGKPIGLTRKDIDGSKSYWVQSKHGPKFIPARHGLKDFKASVDGEYQDMQQRRENSEWVCAHQPGDALRILSGPFEGFSATFKDVRRDDRGECPEVRVEVDVFGRPTTLQIAPNLVAVA